MARVEMRLKGRSQTRWVSEAYAKTLEQLGRGVRVTAPAPVAAAAPVAAEAEPVVATAEPESTGYASQQAEALATEMGLTLADLARVTPGPRGYTTSQVREADRGRTYQRRDMTAEA